jgi:hypothetical protein
MPCYSDESVKKERFGDIGFEIDANTIKERINPTKKKSQNKARIRIE